jgi:hypothetical protein
MTFDFDRFAEKANEVADIRQRAAREGRAVGWPQDLGIFYSPDTPPHVKYRPVLLHTQESWQAHVNAQANDTLIQKLGPGATITAIYCKPELRKLLASGEVERLWSDYFRMYPDVDLAVPYQDMLAESKVRRAKLTPKTSN